MSTPPSVKQWSLRERIYISSVFVKAMLSGAFVLLAYPFLSSEVKQPNLWRELNRRTTRVVVGLSILQLQYAFPSTTKAYLNWLKTLAKKEGVPVEPYSQDLAEGGKLHWVGKKSATKVILHLHSGGYALAMDKGHLNLVNYFRKEVLRRNGIHVKLAFLEYTLTPHASYPTQFHQAVSAIQTILSSGIKPSDILLYGDSAGGQLALQLLGHILHPHPSIPALHLSEPLAGILLLAPWASFSSKTASVKENADRDVITLPIVQAWADAVRDTPLLVRKGDNLVEETGHWLEPALAPVGWWTGAEKVANHVFFVCGEWELLRDAVVDCANHVKEGTKGSAVDVKLVVEPKGMHIAPKLDASFGAPPGESAKIMAGWVAERFIA